MQQEITELKQRHINTTAKIMEYRRKLSELSHRILRVCNIKYKLLNLSY